MQYFLARGWPWGITMLTVPLSCALLGGLVGYPKRLPTIIGALVGSAFGTICTSYCLRLLASYRAKINGGPFRKGDKVRVLGGRYRDQIGLIYEEWEVREQVRVDLGPEARHRVKDVFCSVELCRYEKPARGS